MANPICEKCMNGRNSINGRYCSHLGRYVEYEDVAPCSNKNNSNNQ